MASTQIKPSKDLNNMVTKLKLPDGRDAPRFFGIFSATTMQRQNDSGIWYIWQFEKVDDVASAGMMDMFRDAKKFVEGISAGENKADYSKMAGEENPSTGDSAKAKADSDEEVPF